MGKRKVNKIEKRPFELLGSNGRFILGSAIFSNVKKI